MGDEPPDGSRSVDWPVRLRGVTETVVATRGPTERWNLAALGVRAPGSHAGPEDVALARTWGQTRTRRNFAARGDAFVQFTRDPVDFVEAALTVREADTAILDSADAYVGVEVEEVARGEEGETTWVDWALTPVESVVREEVVPTTNRGYGAVVEASVAASRLDVASYDTEALRARIARLEEVVHTCGGEQEVTAFRRLRDAIED